MGQSQVVRMERAKLTRDNLEQRERQEESSSGTSSEKVELHKIRESLKAHPQ